MCRNIKPLFNFDPPATDDDIRAAALQFVRKIAGTRKPSKANADAFEVAVEEIFQTSRRMLDGLVATTAPRSRSDFDAMRKLRFRKAGTP